MKRGLYVRRRTEAMTERIERGAICRSMDRAKRDHLPNQKTDGPAPRLECRPVDRHSDLDIRDQYYQDHFSSYVRNRTEYPFDNAISCLQAIKVCSTWVANIEYPPGTQTAGIYPNKTWTQWPTFDRTRVQRK